MCHRLEKAFRIRYQVIICHNDWVTLKSDERRIMQRDDGEFPVLKWNANTMEIPSATQAMEKPHSTLINNARRPYNLGG